MRVKTFYLKLTGDQLQLLQKLVEGGAAGASEAEMQVLEQIDAKIYVALYPGLIAEDDPRAHHAPKPAHPMPLRCLLFKLR